jgi:hypothetical protein
VSAILLFFGLNLLRLCVRFWRPWELRFLGLIGNAGLGSESRRRNTCSPKLAPEVGFEPTTNRLTADRSTTELLRILPVGGQRSLGDT